MPIYELDGQAPEFPADGKYWIAETAVLIGRVRMKSHVEHLVRRGAARRQRVDRSRRTFADPGQFHAAHRPRISDGDRRNCVIGHKVMLHGCMVGDNSLIGMGAILLNGSKIGKNSLVGAGALVTEGKSFPDNSLIVGAPARAIRTLDDKAVTSIARGADIYVKRWEQYAKGLKRIG